MMFPFVKTVLAQVVGQNPEANPTAWGDFVSSPWFPAVVAVVAFAVIMATLKREQRLRYLYVYAAGAGILLVLNFLSAVSLGTMVVILVVVGVAASFILNKKKIKRP